MIVFTTLGDGIAALKREERPTPRFGRNEVLVQMTAAALNYRDLLLINGVRSLKPTAPRIPVSDGAGVVVGVGDQVTRLRPGERVASIFNPNWLDGECTPEKQIGALGSAQTDGVLAEYCVFHEQAAVAVPSHLADVEAATLVDSGVTAWNAVRRRSSVQRGDHVLIQGTGGVSTFALLFVAPLGGKPIVLSSSDQKLEKAKSLGAVETINYRKVPAWEEEVLRLTEGRGVDHVIEVVGGENLNRSLRAVRVSGTISFIGSLAGPSAHINTLAIAMKNVAVHGIYTGSREMFEEMNRFIAAHQLRPVIDRTFTFPEFPEALTYLDSRQQFGKVAVAFSTAA